MNHWQIGRNDLSIIQLFCFKRTQYDTVHLACIQCSYTRMIFNWYHFHVSLFDTFVHIDKQKIRTENWKQKKNDTRYVLTVCQRFSVWLMCHSAVCVCTFAINILNIYSFYLLFIISTQHSQLVRRHIAERIQWPPSAFCVCVPMTMFDLMITKMWKILFFLLILLKRYNFCAQNSGHNHRMKRNALNVRHWVSQEFCRMSGMFSDYFNDVTTNVRRSPSGMKRTRLQRNVPVSNVPVCAHECLCALVTKWITF